MLTCSVCGAPAVIAPASFISPTAGSGAYIPGVMFASYVDASYCAEHSPVHFWPLAGVRDANGAVWNPVANAAEPWAAPVVPAGYFDTSKLLTELKTLREENERLRTANAALCDIVRVVAEADNSDHSVCYQLCHYTHIWVGLHGEDMEVEHTAPCVIEQARALLASAENEA